METFLGIGVRRSRVIGFREEGTIVRYGGGAVIVICLFDGKALRVRAYNRHPHQPR